MILVRDGRAEQREDAVASALHDVAFISPYRVDHQLQSRIDDRARLFRVEILLQLRRTLDVGEQRRDGLALAIGNFAGRLCANPDRRLGSLDASP
ncbi:MAG: hypothetical protein WBE78_05280 [Candidatus Binataceae bacterium]